MTDDFSVNPDDLDKFGHSLRDLADQADAAKKYASKWFELSAGEARIYVFAKGMVDQIRENLDGNYDHLAKISGDSADSLTSAARSYRATDGASAARLDGASSEGSR